MNKHILLVENIDNQTSFNDFISLMEKGCTSIERIYIYSPSESITTSQLKQNIVVLQSSSPRKALEKVFRDVRETRANFIYMQSPVSILDHHLRTINLMFQKDQMFGSLIPRFSNNETAEVWTLPTEETNSKSVITRKALSVIPEYWIVPELLTSCMVLRNEIISNAISLSPYTSILACIKHVLCTARRQGFRQIIDNRTVIATSLTQKELYPQISDSDYQLYKDTVESKFNHPTEFGDSSTFFVKNLNMKDPSHELYQQHKSHRLEQLCIEAFPPEGQKRKILFDCRSMAPFHCGITTSQLGYLKGLSELSGNYDLEFTILVQDAALDAHNLRENFPKLSITTKLEGKYAAVIFMSQPCFIGIVKELHKHGFVVSSNMLDTITWDMVMGCPADAEKIWDFQSSYFDIIFYISNFSKKQLNNRFPVAKQIMEETIYLSFTQEENILSPLNKSIGEEHILIFGNAYDHKDVYSTTKYLSDCFPKEKIIAIGPECNSSKNVTFLKSGHLSDVKLAEIIQRAKLIIYPSWIEGFGIPVVNSLAYGKPTLVRSSELWYEIANNSNLPGKLMQFSTEYELKTTVYNALINNYQNVIAQNGGGKNRSPLRWEDCSRNIIDTVERYLESATSNQWLERDKIMRFL